MGDPEKYRTKEEVQKFMENGPIDRFQKYLLGNKFAEKVELEQIESEALEEVEAAVEFARDSPEPEDAALFEHIYAEEYGG